MIDQPFISVIVPTFNRAGLLPHLIESLERQTYPSDRFEVIIVDDGSADGTRRFLTRLPERFRWFAQDHGGASRARNTGAHQALGEIIAFTDDDCTPEPGWLSAIAGAYARYGQRTALLGHTYSEHRSHTFIHSIYKDSEPVVTCNFALPADVFRKVGGFDPHFILYFEDEDLGLRVRRSGVEIVYEPGMRVLHPSKYQSFRQFLRLRSGLKYFCYMSQKHPDADHWQRHRSVVRQIGKKFVFIGLPLLAGFVWHPFWILLAFILAAYVVHDARLALRYRRDLKPEGFDVKAIDVIEFALLNWCVPFIDAAQIMKGYLTSYGTVLPWTAEPVAQNPPATWRLAHKIRKTLGLV